MLTVCSVSCGDSDNEEGSGSDSPKDSYTNTDPFNSFDKGGAGIGYPEGSYAKIEPLNRKDADFQSSLDTGIDQTIESYRSLETKPITFSGNRFEMNSFIQFEDDDYVTYDGAFTVDNGKILFSYENRNAGKYSASISEDYSGYDEEVLSASKQRRAKALDGLSKEEQDKLLSENQLLRQKQKTKEDMLSLNETGTYIDIVKPRLLTGDKSYSLAFLPIFANHTSGPYKQKEQTFILSAVDDFLCVPTYGFRLNGSYSMEKDFTVTCNMLKAYQDDPNSKYNQNQNRTEANLRESINRDVGDLNDTKIEFSGGKWTWTNSKGELLNNGSYLESRVHEGLIGMFIDENSKQAQGSTKYQQKAFEHYKYYCPLLFYIADDGTIWYPGFVKMN